MRITNKIIQNNSLTNINLNKTLQDTLSTMLSSEKKISRPSDDPIIALRSLRLRTSVNQTTQYVEKNVEDAKSWLKVTEDSITTLSNIITDVKKQYVKGSSDSLKPSDRTIILENLESLAKEIYNTGNADFAGRGVFTGFRTDTTLTYQKQENVHYSIIENQDSLRIDTTKYIRVADSENDVITSDITRIRLSYNDLMDNAPTISINGAAVTATVVHSTTVPSPYSQVADAPDAVVYVPETGEILLGSNVAAKPDSITSCEVTYEKENWNRGDLRPEHYFDCDDLTNNKSYRSHSGKINYNIGINQSLQINTTADECFSHNIIRDLQDVISAIKEVDDIESTISKLKSELSGYKDTQVAEKKATQEKIDAAQKAQTFINEKLHSLFSSGISKADGYLDNNNVALTNCGTRSKRLELIENRLDTQLSSLKELKSENEDVDLAETAIKMRSAEYAYDASLMATAKILQETLLNYI